MLFFAVGENFLFSSLARQLGRRKGVFVLASKKRKKKTTDFRAKRESCFPKAEHTWNWKVRRTKAALRHWKRENWNIFQNIWKKSNTPQGSVFLEWTIVFMCVPLSVCPCIGVSLRVSVCMVMHVFVCDRKCVCVCVCVCACVLSVLSLIAVFRPFLFVLTCWCWRVHVCRQPHPQKAPFFARSTWNEPDHLSAKRQGRERKNSRAAGHRSSAEPIEQHWVPFQGTDWRLVLR